MRSGGDAPAVRNAHWHQERVALLKADSLAADLCNKFACRDVNPLILRMMQVKWRAGVRFMLTEGNDKGREPSHGIEGTNDGLLRSDRPRYSIWAAGEA
jgi:hypothetical protein